MSVMIITGASRGIGAAVALLAAESGWDVALSCRSTMTELRSVAKSVEALGRRAVCTQADVSSEADVVALYDAAQTLGPVTCLVNNAGIAPGYGRFVDLSVEAMEQTWSTNITGAFLCAREAVRRMTAATIAGSIVNISSKAAILGGANEWIHYAASKGAVETLTTGLSKEVAAQGIRVNAVRPGLIEGGFGPWDPASRVASMASVIPMQRAGDPREVAQAVVWLASDAASYITGAFVDVTGGR